MNLKKFISGVSALTIAASALAGMAVTASAENTSFFEDFESVEDATAWWDSVQTSDNGNLVASIVTEGTGTTFFANSTKYMNLKGPNGIRTAEKTISVSSEKSLELEGDVRITRGKASSITFKDSSNNIIFVLSGGTGSYNVTATGSSGAAQNITSTYTEFLHFKATVDYTMGKVRVVASNVKNNNKNPARGYSVVLPTSAVSGSSVQMTVSVGNNQTVQMDNLSITGSATTYSLPGTTTLNYVEKDSDPENVLDSKNIDVSSYFAGDGMTYYIPAYVVKDNKLYKANVSQSSAGSGKYDNYSSYTTLNSDVNTLTASYAEYNGDYISAQYQDYDDVEIPTVGRDWTASNGKTKTIGEQSSGYTIATADADGVYDVTVVSSGSTNINNGTISGGTAADQTIAFYTTPNTATLSNTTLHAGDPITITTAGGKSVGSAGVDYVLLVKKDYLEYAVSEPAATNGSYTVTVDGSEVADGATVKANKTLVIAPSANSGYKVGAVSVNGTAAVKNNDGTYSFAMPEAAATVSVTFVEAQPGQINSIVGDSISVTGNSIADNDGINIAANTTSGDVVTVGIEPIDISGKAVNFKAQVGGNSSTTGYITFYTTSDMTTKWTDWYIQGNGHTVQVKNYNNNAGHKVSASSQVDVTLIQSSTNSAVTIYVNGKNTGNYVSSGGKTIAGFKTGRSGGTFDTTIQNLKVVDVTTSNITGGGIDAYCINGYDIPLGTATSGYWHDTTNDKYYVSEGTYPVNGTATLVDEAPAAPSAPLTDAAWEVSDATTGYTQSGNVLTDANGNSVYGYQATLTGNGYAYDTVKVYVKVADGEANDEKTYTGTTFGASGSAIFYVISDTELDKTTSRVYCE